MKFIIVFMCIASLQLSAKVFSQQVSICIPNASFKQLAREIEKQTGLTFLYSDVKTKTLPCRNIDVTSKDVKQLLTEYLQDSELSWKIVENTVVIVPGEKGKAEAPDRLVKGIVTDSKGNSLPGVSVMIKGTNKGISTDPEGRFSMNISVGTPVILVFSFIGMKTQEVKYNGEPLLKVRMEEDIEEMDEVVVTGYQKIDRKLFTGAATRVDSKDVQTGGIADVSNMLEGRVAGVSVQTVSGTFGTAPKIRVRGSSSIYGDTKPLWVVDGVVLEDVVDVAPDELSSGDAKTLISSSVAGINADDIESFQILKDASATALYGARAMNGVIVITTKKGTAGKSRITVTSEFTVRMKPRYGDYDIMNSWDQMSVFRELEEKGWLNHADVAKAADGGVYWKMYDRINQYGKNGFELKNDPESRAKFLQKYEKANTDWFDILFRNSLIQNHSLSLSGGSETARFYVSASWLHDSGWTVADKVDRFTVNMKGDFQLHKKVSLSLQTNGSIRKQQVPGTFDRNNNVVDGEYSRSFDINPFSFALNTSRTVTPYDEDGNPNYYIRNYAPFSILEEYKNNKIDLNVLDLNVQASLNYDITSWLTYNFIGNVRVAKSTQEHSVKEKSNIIQAYRAADDETKLKWNKYLYQDPDNPNSLPQVVIPNGGIYNRSDNQLTNYYFRNTLNFSKNFGGIHSVNVLLGQELKYVDRRYSDFDGYGYQFGKGGTPFTDYRVIKKILEAGSSYYNMSNAYDRFLAGFLNAGYSYAGKYTVNATCRLDGSNRLGESRSARWLPTWNVSGKWNIREENFMGETAWLSALALRGTYGLTASMGPANNSLTIIRSAVADRAFSSDKESMLFIQSLENSDLTWEKQYEANVGLDIAVLNNRIGLELDVYRRKGFDLIASVRTSGIGGEYWKFGNYADMESKGFEFSLNTRNVVLPAFQWNSTLTFSYNTNEITQMEYEPLLFDLVTAEGSPKKSGPVRGLYSIPFRGLDKNGFPTFSDGKGGVINEYINFQSSNTDYLKYEGPVDPKITGGFANTLKYKNWTMNVFFSYQFGANVRLTPAYRAYYSDWNAMTKDMKNRWLMPGDEKITNVPVIPTRLQIYEKGGLITAYNAYNYSDQRVARGDFIRLKDISLNYDFPQAWMSRIGFKAVSLKVQATNLCLLLSDKKLNGQDPEFFGAGGIALPVPRQFTFTLKIGI